MNRLEDERRKRLDRSSAEEWACWFAVLGDPTRVLILHVLAVAEGPLTVGEITERVDVGQSTVSHHLARLAEVCFASVERVGTTSLWQVNRNCLGRFPDAAEAVMGVSNAAVMS